MNEMEHAMFFQEKRKTAPTLPSRPHPSMISQSHAADYISKKEKLSDSWWNMVHFLNPVDLSHASIW